MKDIRELTTLEKNMLSCIPHGVENAISTKELANKLSINIRTARGVISDLRYKGFLIGSNKNTHGGGYYKINSYAEGVNTLNMLEKQRNQTSKLIAVFRKSLNISKGLFEDSPTYSVTNQQLNFNLEGMQENADYSRSRTTKRNTENN